MSIEEIIKVLVTERTCVKRQSGRGCDRTCERCDLVLDDKVISKAYEDAIALLRTYPEAQPNEPLTQKQLQFMSGDPVWIVREDGADRWALIRYANSGGINTYGCGFLTWEDLGKIWFPYRRPPKEEK